MKNDKHTLAIPEAVVAQSLMKLGEVKELLAPFKLALTPEERQKIAKMGEKSQAFVEKAHTLAGENLDLVPNFLDMQTYNTDFSDAHDLVALSTSAKQVCETISDIAMAAGSEAYQASLVFYNSVKVAAAQDVPEAKAVYEELKSRFPRGKHKSAETEDKGKEDGVS